MKKLSSKIFLLSFLTLTSFASYAGEQVLMLVNHYNQPLKVIVGRNPEVLPGFPRQEGSPAVFILDEKNPVAASVILNNNKEAYIRVEKADDSKISGFFGIGYKDNAVTFYGYEGSHGLAFSPDKVYDGIITFCTSEEFESNKVNGKHGHC